MNLKVFCSILILCVGFSCSSGEVYYQFEEIDAAEGWSKDDTLFFDIDSSLIVPHEPYSLSIECVNNTDFLYQNLWLYVYDDFDGGSFTKSEKEYLLSDALGKWLGSGFGTLYQLSVPYKDGIVFDQKKNYRVKVVHGMRDEPLVGIEKIGLKLVRATE